MEAPFTLEWIQHAFDYVVLSEKEETIFVRWLKVPIETAAEKWLSNPETRIVFLSVVGQKLRNECFKEEKYAESDLFLIDEKRRETLSNLMKKSLLQIIRRHANSSQLEFEMFMQAFSSRSEKFLLEGLRLEEIRSVDRKLAVNEEAYHQTSPLSLRGVIADDAFSSLIGGHQERLLHTTRRFLLGRTLPTKTRTTIWSDWLYHETQAERVSRIVKERCLELGCTVDSPPMTTILSAHVEKMLKELCAPRCSQPQVKTVMDLLNYYHLYSTQCLENVTYMAYVFVNADLELQTEMLRNVFVQFIEHAEIADGTRMARMASSAFQKLKRTHSRLYGKLESLEKNLEHISALSMGSKTVDMLRYEIVMLRNVKAPLAWWISTGFSCVLDVNASLFMVDQCAIAGWEIMEDMCVAVLLLLEPQLAKVSTLVEYADIVLEKVRDITTKEIRSIFRDMCMNHEIDERIKRKLLTNPDELDTL